MSKSKPKESKANERVQRYVQALLDGEEESVSMVVEETLREGWQISQVYMELLTPAQNRIGQLWSNEDITTAQEHLATQLTLAQMERLRSGIRVKDASGHHVIVGVVEGDEHFLGALMVADIFRSDGWAVDFLGGGVPFEDLVQIVRDRTPHLVALSARIQVDPERIRCFVKAVQGLSRSPKILLGGPGFGVYDPETSLEFGAPVATDLAQALTMGRDLVGRQGQELTLDAYLRVFGQRIREQRRRSSMTQKNLANRAGLDRTYIVGVEQGRQNVTLGAVLRIAQALNIDVDQLLAAENNAQDR